jgi:hypothetical protein
VIDKREYVKSQQQTRKHTCHWPGCARQVPPAMWGCKPHWFKLPKWLRDKVFAAFVPGQEIHMTPSREYVTVAREVQAWIKENA